MTGAEKTPEHGAETTPELQVADDPRLLELMFEDTEAAPEAYRPTNFWAYKESVFLPELERRGLRDFRSRKNSVLESFGATDLAPTQIDFRASRVFRNPLVRALPFHQGLARALNALAERVAFTPSAFEGLRKLLPIQANPFYEVGPADLHQIAYEFAHGRGEAAGARPIDALEASPVGSPEGLFTIDGRAYTMRTFFYYLQYAYCCRFMDFDGVRVFVELGSGAGRQAEVVKKLHPDATILLFDIPPQLYVCEQYLKALFPDSLVSYRETRKLESLEKIEPGQILVLGTWKFPLLDGIDVDLFWNSASFQEMEPEVVANYLRFVDRSARAVFLKEIMAGKPLAKNPGAPGVLRATTLEDYQAGLPSFELTDMSPTRFPAGNTNEKDFNSFWVRL